MIFHWIFQNNVESNSKNICFSPLVVFSEEFFFKKTKLLTFKDSFEGTDE